MSRYIHCTYAFIAILFSTYFLLFFIRIYAQLKDMIFHFVHLKMELLLAVCYLFSLFPSFEPKKGALTKSIR